MQMDAYSELSTIVENLAKGIFTPTGLAFRGLVEWMAKFKSLDGQTQLLLEAYVRMLGQLARQIQAVSLPELVEIHMDVMRFGMISRPSTTKDLRALLDRIDHAARSLYSELLFRMPDDPRPVYPPAPEFLLEGKRRLMKVDELISLISEQSRLVNRYAQALRAGAPIGKDDSDQLDHQKFKEALTCDVAWTDLDWDYNSDDGNVEFEKGKELIETEQLNLLDAVEDLLDEAVDFAKRRHSALISACCDLREDAESYRYDYDLPVKLKRTLDALWQESLSQTKATGKSPGRPKSSERAKQISMGLRMYDAAPNSTLLQIAADVLDNCATCHSADSVKQGYPNTPRGIKTLAEAIGRAKGRSSHGKPEPERPLPPSSEGTAMP